MLRGHTAWKYEKFLHLEENVNSCIMTVLRLHASVDKLRYTTVGL